MRARAAALAKAKEKDNQKLVMEKEQELSAMVGSSKGRTIELTDTASKIAAANRQVDEMRKFYEMAGKEIDGKSGK
jgi:hypothetical protein